MKRKLKIDIEIDCEDLSCGDCAYHDYPFNNHIYLCTLFLDKDGDAFQVITDKKRCLECLNCEIRETENDT